MKTASSLAIALLVAGCAAPVDEIGVPPRLSAVGSGVANQGVAAYPSEPAKPVTRFSLWDDRQSRLFTDPRALAPGDILTVEISINDRARFRNESDRKRDVSRSLGLSAALGLPTLGVSQEGEGTFDIKSGTAHSGAGATSRSEDIKLRVAAIVTDVLPNGNLRITGSQEVRVNAELRVLTIEGYVRPMDIGSDNTISYERIAEARISYGGRGRLTEVQQPPYGQQVLDNVLPF